MSRFSIFLFQAEDGIRYLVRSRGLGDVYKRQTLVGNINEFTTTTNGKILKGIKKYQISETDNTNPVSYTHLTLPTSDLV